MKINKMKTNLGDTVKIIFKSKAEYEHWLQYVKEVCITCEKVDPIFEAIPKDLEENVTENLDTGEYMILLLPEITARFVIGFMELCVVQKRHEQRDKELLDMAKQCVMKTQEMTKIMENNDTYL